MMCEQEVAHLNLLRVFPDFAACSLRISCFFTWQMGLDRLLSYTQPSVLDDVQSFLDVPDTENFSTVQYVGMHVRDIPPRMFGTFKATETLVGVDGNNSGPEVEEC